MERSISELSAIGSPTRDLVTAMNVVRDLFLVAFAAGVSGSAEGAPALRSAGGLLAANAGIDAAVSALLPRDGSQPTWSRRNTTNTLVMATGVASYMGAMIAAALGPLGRFRVVSAGIPLSYAGLTALTLFLPARDGTRPATTGAQERSMAYSYQLWVAMLAMALLRLDRRGA